MPGTILVVDDDTLIREMVKDCLAPEGYSFTEASNGREALEQLERSTPDAVILDLFMPEQSGFETLLQIRQRLPELAVIIISSFDTPELIQAALRAGASSFIVKPFHPLEMVDAVQRLPMKGKP